jgi:hypothetical protein
MIVLRVTSLGWLGKYKWRLDEEDYVYQTAITGFATHGINEYVSIDDDGALHIKRGYCWNGANGPTWDTLSCRRGSMVHDALYQLISEGILPRSFKEVADRILYDLLLEDGMWKWRADGWYWAVDTYGDYFI